MVLVTAYALLFLIPCLGYCQENGRIPQPLLNISKPYIDVAVNNPLTIECRGEKEVEWYFTKPRTKDPIISKDFTGLIKRAFIHLQPSYDFTGLYICSYKDIDNAKLKRNNASVYVFMNDPEHLFVNQTEFNTTLHLVQNNESHLYVPCLPTNSKVNVTLWESSESSEVKHVPISDVIKFDPTKGFLVLEPLSRDFFCKGYWNGSQEQTALFSVKATNDSVTKPFIDWSSPLWSVGRNNYLSCSVAVVNYEASQFLNWTYPRSTDKVTTLKEGELLVKNRQNYDLLFNTLNLTMIEISDEGFYSCSLKMKEEEKILELSKEEIYIPINDGEPVKFETTMNISPYIVREAGDSVEFSVSVTNYKLEEIEIHWEKNGLLIQDTARMKLHTNSLPITLSISKLEISDAGEYTLTARIYQSTISNISFILAIKSAPSIQIVQPLSDDRFYEYGNKYNMECKVESFNRPTVNWFWQNCSNWDVCDGYSPLSSNNVLTEEGLDNYMFRVKSTLTVEAEKSGTLHCEASNNDSKGAESINFTVTDILGGKPTLLTEESDPSSPNPSVEVHCEITSMIYENISWSFIRVPGNYDMVDINNLPEYSIKGEMQDYSELSTLSFSPKKDRSGLYACTFIDKRNKKQLDKFIAVHISNDPLDPTASTVPPNISQAGLTPTIVTIISVVAVAVLLIIITIIAVAAKIWRKRRLYDPYGFHTGQVNLINPNLPLEEQVDLLPYDPKWEFPKDRLKLGRVVGHGAFGRVVKADAIGLEPNIPHTTVAVKMLKDKNDDVQYKSLMAELKIMIHLGRHVNIVNLKGAVTKNLYKGELMVMVEYCCHGNLRSFLLRHREKFINQVDQETGKVNRDIISEYITEPAQENKQGYDYTKPFALGISNPSYDQSSTGQLIMENSGDSSTHDTNLSGRDTSTGTVAGSESGYSSTGDAINFPFISKEAARYSGYLTTSDLLCYCFQCAQGMSYLASRKLLHRDLAARNVLLAEGNVIKISDFGLAKDVYKYSKYVKKSDIPLPVKWMAFESIRDRVFTIKSDVWSFGVLMWEIFTLGGNPYPGVEMNEEFFKRLQEGYRMEKPEFSPTDVYGIMLECWQKNPKDRPNFTDLSEQLANMLEDSVKEYYLDLNVPYASLNVDLPNIEDYLNMNTPNYLQMDSSLQETDVDKGPDYVTAADINIAQEQPKHTYYNIPPLIEGPDPNEQQSSLEAVGIQMNSAKAETDPNDREVTCKENLQPGLDALSNATDEFVQNRTKI